MIPVKRAKQIREEFGFTHLIIFGLSKDNVQYVATHGATVTQAKEAANLGNNLKRSMGWPEYECKAKPLVRKCEVCTYWKRKKIDNSSRIPEDWPGNCMFNPEPAFRYAEDRACNHFEPDC
jgi:hypothetical protein